MRGVLAPQPGGADNLRIVEARVPRPGPDEVLIEVKATAVNRADTLQREGRYPPPPGVTEILGLEAAGHVASIGDEVRGWRVGDRVMALLSGGGYADYVSVPAEQLMPVPDRLDLVTAAAIPEAFLTAWMALRHLARLSKGEVALVHAGASGVGTAAVQIARELGASALATSRSAGRLETAERLGATAIVSPDGIFAPAVKDASDGGGADVVLDLLGAGCWNENVDALAQGGRIVMLSLMTGARTEVDFGRLLPLQATLYCATLRARSVAEKHAIIRDFAPWGLPRFEEGRLEAIVDRVLPLEEAAEAHRVMEQNQAVGKIVLTTGVANSVG